jgi:hypothetical protein
MPKVKNVEKRTKLSMSSFGHTDSRDMRGDKNDVTVADWKARRSAGIYPGLAIEVLDGDGNAGCRQHQTRNNEGFLRR